MRGFSILKRESDIKIQSMQLKRNRSIFTCADFFDVLRFIRKAISQDGKNEDFWNVQFFPYIWVKWIGTLIIRLEQPVTILHVMLVFLITKTKTRRNSLISSQKETPRHFVESKHTKTHLIFRAPSRSDYQFSKNKRS